MNTNKKVLASACLVGFKCRYDCQSKTNKSLLDLYHQGRVIAVCPEELGGLPTPRIPAEQINDKVIDKEGNDVTQNYRDGAKKALKMAQESGCTEAYLKTKSPMCGSSQIYDGSFKGILKNGDGVFTKLLKEHHFKIFPTDQDE